MSIKDSSRFAIFFLGSVLAAAAVVYSYTKPEVGFHEMSSSTESCSPNSWSICPFDEPFSIPDQGSSLFDKIFSVKNATGMREYSVPYPITRVFDKLKSATGGVEPTITLFPMGRSLQRSAAVHGLAKVENLDPYYRFPRIVLGYTKESINANGLRLNLKDRFYIGMNERAKLLEVISYNDEAGRFEYQVVRDFEAGKKPQVLYANRQLCLSCHQNQTPIFSQQPWSESNANVTIASEMQRVLQKELGSQPCSSSTEKFCYRDEDGVRNFYYWGAALAVDPIAPYSLDQATKVGNYFHGYHKLWQRLCPDIACRRSLLKQVLLFKLTGQTGLLLTAEQIAFNQKIDSIWRSEFKDGLKIPNAEIPNRDPLLNQKDRGRAVELLDGRGQTVRTGLEQLIANSDVPGELEPLMSRAESETWQTPFVKLNGVEIPRLVIGYAQFFTESDAVSIDRALRARGIRAQDRSIYRSNCKIRRGAGANLELTLNCEPLSTGLKFSAFLSSKNGDAVGSTRKIQVFDGSCNAKVLATPENIARGLACQELANVRLRIGSQGLEFWQNSGLALRTLDGRRFLPVALPQLQSSSEKQVALDFALLWDLKPLGEAIDNTIVTEPEIPSDGFVHSVDGNALNRNKLMALVLRILDSPQKDFENLSKEMRSLKRVSEAPPDELKELPLNPNERALALANRNCAACHFNREGVPPPFLGGPEETSDFAHKMKRLAICAPRMLYRLKMWECANSDFEIKKTPMPPISRMRATHVDLASWKAGDRRQLMDALWTVLADSKLNVSSGVFSEASLLAHLRRQGLSEANAKEFVQDLRKPSCPKALSTEFEKLPSCD